jgi:hypothetical protein
MKWLFILQTSYFQQPLYPSNLNIPYSWKILQHDIISLRGKVWDGPYNLFNNPPIFFIEVPLPS